VLYEALSCNTLSSSGRRRANSGLRVASALFGLLSPTDRIPAYRLSGGTSLPGLGVAGAVWRPVLEPELAAHRGLVVDLRSGPYAALARCRRRCRCASCARATAPRTVVSHDNKYTKGLLARQLCERGARSIDDVAAAGRQVADLVEVDGRGSTSCCSASRPRALLLADRAPEVDAALDRVRVDLGQLVAVEVQPVEGCDVLLQLRDAARTDHERGHRSSRRAHASAI
jgi:hypothetical protein